MMREQRTLKTLFPEPRPPRRKNFIKENVKNLKKMEQLFHTNGDSANDLKLPALRQTKISHKSSSVSDKKTVHTDDELRILRAEEAIEKGMQRLLSQQNSQKHDSNRKKSAPIYTTNKKFTSKKLTRSPGSGFRKNHGYREQHIDHKSQNHPKIKASSEANVSEIEKSEANKRDEHANIKCKSQSVQTLDEKDICSLYSEGIIRYPSGRAKELAQKSKRSDVDDTVLLSDSNQVNANDSLENPSNDGVDYVKLNKERVSLASKLASQLNNTAPQPSYRVGVVPKYIKERKEALHKERLAKASAKLTDCPTGHVPLPDNERKETLGLLKNNYQEYVNELNMLPIRTDTLRSQKRKMEIEKELTKLEEAIKVFSRPKVFVKLDS